jgi:hypothetical protein
MEALSIVRGRLKFLNRYNLGRYVRIGLKLSVFGLNLDSRLCVECHITCWPLSAPFEKTTFVSTFLPSKVIFIPSAGSGTCFVLLRLWGITRHLSSLGETLWWLLVARIVDVILLVLVDVHTFLPISNLTLRVVLVININLNENLLVLSLGASRHIWIVIITPSSKLLKLWCVNAYLLGACVAFFGT